MEVYAKIKQKVQIDPKDVIENLIEKEIGTHGWIFETDGKLYKGWEESAGSHSYDAKEEISKEKYDYIIALQTVLKQIKKLK